MSAKNVPVRNEKIFPLNLTAMAATMVKGNPVTTRMESGVANCYPGLDIDHRNLDRRFFPGLVFEFVPQGPGPLREGARLLSVDLTDPDLEDPAATLLFGDTGQTLSSGAWFLESISQGGKTIKLRQRASGRPPLEGMIVWRLVRSLQPGPLRIVLARRPEANERVPAPRTVKLSGSRRRFLDAESGVISDVYVPGELTQSLCSPWMHDFRDCACTYWASNHPDIVLPEATVGGGDNPVTANPDTAETRIDWLRADRWPARTAAAEGTEGENRAAQLDHYEINQRWQDLSIVLMDREVSRTFNARQIETAATFDTPDKLAAELVKLAELEHVVALEYLYAMFSVKDPADVRDPALRDALTFVRHELLMIAVSEMRHLRWANQLIWELEHANLTTKKFGPALGVAETVPDEKGKRKRCLEPLTEVKLNSFIAVEKPSGSLDGAYAGVLSTLRLPEYSGMALEQLAARILADGMQHYSRFRQIKAVLDPYLKPNRYLNNIEIASRKDPLGAKAYGYYRKIVGDLEQAYARGDMEDAHLIADARKLMFELSDTASKLATKGLGVPYFEKCERPV